MEQHFGYKNNNPGNIRYTQQDKWQGLAANPRYVPAWDEEGFFVFAAPVWGLRAMAKLLISYRRRRGCNTLRKVFARWSPVGDGDNDPLAYATAIASALSSALGRTVSIDEELDFTSYEVLRPLLPAMCRHETGQEPAYPGRLYDQALLFAGVRLPVRPFHAAPAAPPG
jgi:hypothetical protein